MAAWRYIAQRLTGDGKGEFLDMDVPLTDVEITDVLTGDNELSGKIDPEYARLIASDGRPLFDEWGTAIYAEHQGNIRAGGILVDSSFEGPSWSLDCFGFTHYLNGMPYTGARNWTEKDVAFLFRHIWEHVQAQPNGNLGLEVDATFMTGRLLGDTKNQIEFDTENGPIQFEAGPYKLAKHLTQDLSQNVTELAEVGPFDWRETHYWDGEKIRHSLDLAKSFGTKRNDLRFVIGENVAVIPSIDRSGEGYASDVLVLGAGDGSQQKTGMSAHIVTGRLRRVAVVGDSSLRSLAKCTKRAEAEVQWRNRLEDISEIVVHNHPHAPLGSVEVGDVIMIEGDTGWIDLDTEVKVLSRSIRPDTADQMTLEIARTDRLTA